MNILIRSEQPGDIDIITRLTEEAFKTQRHSNNREQHIVNALRREGELTVSLVAIDGDALVGHVAISPVTISSNAPGWYGLGPISVAPERQRQGIGSLLMKAALAELQRMDRARGCVLLGNPAFYNRFGFSAHPDLCYPGVDPAHFMALSFDGQLPKGRVSYHGAFDDTE